MTRATGTWRAPAAALDDITLALAGHRRQDRTIHANGDL